MIGPLDFTTPLASFRYCPLEFRITRRGEKEIETIKSKSRLENSTSNVFGVRRRAQDSPQSSGSSLEISEMADVEPRKPAILAPFSEALTLSSELTYVGQLPETVYPAIVSEIQGNTAFCDVQVGEVELRLAFPRKVLNKHRLKIGSLFRWRPTQSGEVREQDVIPEHEHEIKDEELRKGLDSLSNLSKTRAPEMRLAVPSTFDFVPLKVGNVNYLVLQNLGQTH